MIATQHSGEGKANQYFLRGFDLDHGTDIDITLDDMPVNMRTHGHGQGYADLNFMIPELISTLHYSKGPYFPDVGDFDTAGAVQINYVDTLPRDLALVTAGTLGYYRGLGAMSRPAGAGNLLAAAEYVHANGPWTIPDNYNKGNLVLNYSQGNLDNGFSLQRAPRAPASPADRPGQPPAGSSVDPRLGAPASASFRPSIRASILASFYYRKSGT